MRRRLVLALPLLVGATRAWAQEARAPRHRVSAGELHRSLSTRFPVRFTLAGLLALDISAPALLLDARRNRLGATVQAQAGGPALQPMPPGEMDVVFRLRYEPRDRSLRAYEPEILALRWPGLPSEAAASLQRTFPTLAEDALGEIVLHRFTPRELALPETLGFQPESFTVADDGLVVVFGRKR
jgi:hypothetical protein